MSQKSADLSATDVGIRSTHHRGLDGLRGIAVILVLVFHSGLDWLPGGFLGVSLFFTLSGYLIVNLLLLEGERAGRIDLRAFWSRRLRRLAPASLAVVAVVVSLATWLSTTVEADRIRGDAISAMVYVANWRFIIEGQTYDQLFATPSPLQHLWSLSIEEQMYLLVPLVVTLVFAWGGGRRVLSALFSIGISASVLASVATDRDDVVYYGTHARAAELLLGALLACLIGGPRARDAWHSRLWAAPGSMAVLVVIVLARVSDVRSVWLYGGGLALFSLVSAVAILGSIVPGVTARVLGWTPLVVVGQASYGLYLIHWPIIVWLNEERLGLDGVILFAAQMGVTGLIAWGSYRLLEMPIRERRMLRQPLLAATTFIVSVIVTIGLAVTFLPSVDATPDARIQVLTTVPRPVTTPFDQQTDPGSTFFDSRGPLNILVVGDSTAENIARGLADAADSEIGVVSGGVLGCPLISSDRVRDRVTGEQDVTYCPDVFELAVDNASNVDVILVVVGIANQWDYLPAGRSQWVTAGSLEQRVALDSLMERIQNHVAALSVATLVLEAPSVRDDPVLLGDDPRSIAAWSEVIEGWDREWASVRMVPYADLLSDPDSQSGRVERPDGVHLDRAFAADLARDHLIPRIRQAWASTLADVAES